jgi:hypothetical protein
MDRLVPDESEVYVEICWSLCATADHRQHDAFVRLAIGD